jgi:hypothetical protein
MANLLFTGLPARGFYLETFIGTPRDWPSHSIYVTIPSRSLANFGIEDKFSPNGSWMASFFQPSVLRLLDREV